MEKDQTRVELPMQMRLAPIDAVNTEARTANVVWSTGARVRRYDWQRDREYWEELGMRASEVDLTRLNGGAPLLDSHNRWSLADVLGVVEPGSASVDGARGVAVLRFSAREEVTPIFRDVTDKIIVNVSVGYTVERLEQTADVVDGLPVYRATKWTPAEVSLVPIGADAGAGVRSEAQQAEQARYPCELIHRSNPSANSAINQERTMTPEQQAQAAAVEAANQAAAQAAREAAEVATRAAAVAAAATAERARVNDIMARCDQLQLPAEFRNSLINEGASLEEAGRRIIDQMAQRQQAAQGTVSGVNYGDGARALGDPAALRREHMTDAVLHRIAPNTRLEDGPRQYRNMSLLRLAEELLIAEGVNVRQMSRMDIATRGMMSVTDFSGILADVANKRLRMAYEENVPSYLRWARRAPNAPDFKNINVVALSSAPDLQAVPAGAEFKYGAMADSKEVYAIATYGRIIPLSRQAIINDDLSAFDRLPRLFGGAARRLENYTVYQTLLANANMADGVALFHATHGNLPSAAAISIASLTLARAMMRKQLGLAQEPLNIAPAYLLCGPDKEQEAYQYTSSQYVPATSGAVNEFRAGGRTSLEPIVETLITGTKWFLAADYNQVDTAEFCYLDGSEGVYIEQNIGFKSDGIELKARLDFAAKVIDFRGLVYNSGA